FPHMPSSDSPSIAENSTAVTTVTATDNDLDDTVTFSITGGADHTKVTITPAGALTFNQATDYESPNDEDLDNSYFVQVTADDGHGGTDTKMLTIAVSDMNEFDVGAVTDSDASSNEVTENAKNGTNVGVTTWASDADATNNNIKYSLDDSAGGRFAIGGSSGVVSVAGAIDREAAASYDIVVRATGSDGRFLTQTFTIAVNDVDEF